MAADDFEEEFSMKKPIFRGAGVAIITPFTETGINYPELGRIIDDQIAGGTDAIIITGTTGESSTTSDEEHKEAIRFAVEHTRGRIPVIAGTGSNDTTYAVQLSQYAETVGADAVDVSTPAEPATSGEAPVVSYYKDKRARVYDFLGLQAILIEGWTQCLKEGSGVKGLLSFISYSSRWTLNTYGANEGNAVGKGSCVHRSIL